MFPQRYDAHYIFTTDQLPVEIRTSSDGKGRLRSEVSNSGLNRSITLTDYVGGVVYRISTSPRMVFDPRVISKMELVDASTDEQPESLFEIPSGL
jgi:hypothetical protein